MVSIAEQARSHELQLDSPQTPVTGWANSQFNFFYYWTQDPLDRLRIKNKVGHTNDATFAARQIAPHLPSTDLEQPLIMSAEVHDLGRAPQIIIGKSFSDYFTRIDHAQVSADMLEECPIDFPYRDEVIQAVRLHSCKDPDSDHPLVLALRDADQLALLRKFPDRLGYNPILPGKFPSGDLSYVAYDQFQRGDLVNSAFVSTMADRLVQLLAWTTRFNFPITTELCRRDKIPHQLLYLLTLELNPHPNHGGFQSVLIPEITSKLQSVYPQITPIPVSLEQLTHPQI